MFERGRLGIGLSFVELISEGPVVLRDIHQLLVAQSLAEVLQSILLILRTKRRLDGLFLFEILSVLCSLLAAQIGMHFEVLTGHAKQTSLAHLFLSLSLGVPLCQVVIYLDLLSLVKCLSLFNLAVKPHLSHLGLCHDFLLRCKSLVRVKSAGEVAVAIVEQVSCIRCLSCRFTVFFGLLTQADDGCLTWPKGGLAAVVKVQFVLVDDTIHELVALTRS